MLEKVGKVVEMKKFATHCAAAATASAPARIRLGNISPSSTHTSGPQVAPKATTNRFAATSAIGDHGASRVTSPPLTLAKEKASAMSPRETVMKNEPASSMGRRPTLSTRRIARIVTAMLVTDVMTVMVRASDSWKPTVRHSVVE